MDETTEGQEQEQLAVTNINSLPLFSPTFYISFYQTIDNTQKLCLDSRNRIVQVGEGIESNAVGSENLIPRG